MRRLDQQFYVVLTIHSWPRGRPFLPVSEETGLFSSIFFFCFLGSWVLIIL